VLVCAVGDDWAMTYPPNLLGDVGVRETLTGRLLADLAHQPIPARKDGLEDDCTFADEDVEIGVL